MPPAVNSSQHYKVTQVTQLIDANSIESVCKAGDRCRISFATRRGIVAVTVPLASFIEHARADRDANHNPFEPAPAGPSAYEVGQQRRWHQLQQDACTVPAKGVPPSAEDAPWLSLPAVGPLKKRSTQRPEHIAILRQAWCYYIADARISRARLAIVLGVAEATLIKYFTLFAQEPGAPALKPSGRLA